MHTCIHTYIHMINIKSYMQIKCGRYWPQEESQRYGDITVTNQSENLLAEYATRQFKLKKVTLV